MTITAQRLFEEAMRLEPEERAALTGLLIDSLEPGFEQGAEEAWLAETERRMAELDSGTVQTVSWEDLRSRLFMRPDGSGRS